MKRTSRVSSIITRTLGATFALGFALGGFVPTDARAANKDGGTVVHLSHYSDDLHAVSMALKVATMIQTEGQKTVLFVDLEGARLADKRVPNEMKWGPSESTVGELFASFVKAGGKIRVCPHCAKAAGLDEANLREGASILTHEDLALLLTRANKVIDY